MNEVNSDTPPRGTSNKRKRIKLTKTQLARLERVFITATHPGKAVKQQLSGEIGIPVKNIQIWFQNRRQKEKRKGGKSLRMNKRSILYNIYKYCIRKNSSNGGDEIYLFHTVN